MPTIFLGNQTEGRDFFSMGFPRGSLIVKNLPAMWETWVQSLSQEGPLEKEMATYSSSLAWRSPWTEETDGLQSTGPQRVGT